MGSPRWYNPLFVLCKSFKFIVGVINWIYLTREEFKIGGIGLKSFILCRKSINACRISSKNSIAEQDHEGVCKNHGGLTH